MGGGGCVICFVFCRLFPGCAKRVGRTENVISCRAQIPSDTRSMKGWILVTTGIASVFFGGRRQLSKRLPLTEIMNLKNVQSNFLLFCLTI